MSSYSASSILLILPRVPFCYTLVGQITFSQELRLGQNKSIRTHCSEWDKRVLTIDTNRNNLRHETKEWKKYRSYLLISNAGSNLRLTDFTIWRSHIQLKISRSWVMTHSRYIKDHPAYCLDHRCQTFDALKYITIERTFQALSWQGK